MKNYTGIFVKIVLYDNDWKYKKYGKRSEFHIHWTPHHSSRAYSIIFFFQMWTRVFWSSWKNWLKAKQWF